MKLEEIKKELKKFDKFKFFPEDHHYECNGKKVGMSVTRLIEEYAQPFDQQGIAEKCAIRDNKTVTQVLKEWKYKNDYACVKGSNCHEYAQSRWSGEIYHEDEFDASVSFKMALKTIYKQADNFYEDFKDKFTHIKDEQVVGAEEYDICSAIDHLFQDKDENVWLIDYKTNSILKGYNDDEKSRRYTKNMKVPLHELKDDSLHHYYLQLSIYKYIIEKYTNIHIYKMMIVYMSENIQNYELIDIPYLEAEAKIILENRSVRKMGKCIPVLLIGKSGTGKSTSLRNFEKDEIAIANVLGKPLPFRNELNAPKVDDYNVILKAIESTDKKVIVIDDAGYLITNEFMSKVSVKGFDKYNEIGNNFFKLINGIKNIDGDKTVYLIMHEDNDDEGNIKPKTIGKLLDDKVNIAGMFTICIRSVFEDGKYKFRLRTNGQDCVKTPLDMFEEEEIENDLKYVDNKIREYYNMAQNEENKNKGER